MIGAKAFMMGVFLIAVFLIGACRGTQPPPTLAPTLVVADPTPDLSLPRITGVALDQAEVQRYETLGMTVALTADYTNPYDARGVRLDGFFTGPDGGSMTMPGFWDGEGAWRIRFTPSLVGEWRYRLVVTDGHGASPPAEGAFQATPSDRHGWLQVGSWVNPAYSSRYLVFHDGSPFYGVGHCDALNILIDGFDIERGVGLFDTMAAANENYVVWWPFYANSLVNSSYDRYSVSNMKVIDMIIKDAEAKGIFLIFTLWDHPQLRDASHAWGDGRWNGNGFRKLGDLVSFFTSSEAWDWQENLYRYVIARWSASPAIGMWMTISEINGTNAYVQTDSWHSKVNAYFVAHDPYRHPTTASQSGDVDWPEGFAVMDALQVHVYDLDAGPIAAAETLAFWTMRMSEQAAKPNWVGEFGVTDNAQYPELFHHAIWAALGAGAAMTPAEWNSGGAWMRMTPAMSADMSRLAQFVAGLPLAAWQPEALRIASSDPLVRGWGVAGREGGLFWVQDASLTGLSAVELRDAATVHSGVQVTLDGPLAGAYIVRPYDTWQGVYRDALAVDCAAAQPCTVALPSFTSDIAFKIERP